MADDYTDVTVTGWGTRILDSITGAVFGAILFFGSFIVLFWNEGRVDLADIASNLTSISADAPANVAPGTGISAYGALSSEQPLGDNLYLKPGPYVAVQRTAEMYAWHESMTTDEHKNPGGSTTKTTNYHYSMKWVESPQSSFAHPEGHVNPPQSIRSDRMTAGTAKLGVYSMNLSTLTYPTPDRVALLPETLNLNQTNQTPQVSGEYLYVGKGTSENPVLGDIRIKYEVLKSGAAGTFFGALSTSTTLDSYSDSHGNRLYRFFASPPGAAIATLHSEYVTSTWIFRGVGFAMMWIGLMLVFKPLSTLLDFFPMLGSIVDGITAIGSLILSILMSGATIIASAIIHSPGAVAGAVLVTFVIGARFVRKQQEMPSPAQFATVPNPPIPKSSSRKVG